MRVLTWVIRLAIFLFLLAFAARNTDPVTLRFYFDLAWQMPLVALLVGFFIAGALLGVAAALRVLIRQRREIGRLEREANARGALPRQATVESMSDTVLAEFEAQALEKTSLNCRLQLANALLHSMVDRLALANERNAIKVSKDAPLEVLGPLGCGIQTGAGAVLNALRVSTGSSFVAFGAGAVGLSAVMAARIAGATTIIAADVVPSRLEIAKELAATHVINSKQQDPVKAIQEIAGGGAHEGRRHLVRAHAERRHEGAVAQEIDHPRHTAADAVNAGERGAREGQRPGQAGHPQAMLHVAEGVLARQRREVAADADALIELPQLPAAQRVLELRLPHEHDLQQLPRGRLESGQDADLLQ